MRIYKIACDILTLQIPKQFTLSICNSNTTIHIYSISNIRHIMSLWKDGITYPLIRWKSSIGKIVVTVLLKVLPLVGNLIEEICTRDYTRRFLAVLEFLVRFQSCTKCTLFFRFAIHTEQNPKTSDIWMWNF